jgi:hypothetical protein
MDTDRHEHEMETSWIGPDFECFVRALNEAKPSENGLKFQDGHDILSPLQMFYYIGETVKDTIDEEVKLHSLRLFRNTKPTH